MAYTPVSREVAEGVRDAAVAVDGVAALHGGRVGEIATYLPNTRIEGLKAISRDGRTGFEVHFVFDVASGRKVQDVAEDVRAAVLGASDAEFVDVVAGDAQ
ncbi:MULTISPECIES: hypothetical protein [Mycobacteriales]|uniref:Asp23/Gls24 family envelope stress response protein n=2 Tax=Corynebacterium TaxID=1716 RepID=A0A7W2ECI0_9CORY|nr:MULTISPECIES: hypothetical protein [Mycobacteriales]MBA5245126.1 hypothetical protein [Corynebacterium haemomassiliense]MBF6476882.1 hypothetical protein [Nocardia cyriacigeorgica]MCG7235812.1 hypothetical protein [Corynebacterium sp. ACRQP]MCG7289337.1 hypothetical protein [Corynebacterium sp. ACRPZ]MCG7293447.1 hypothetical protein [Corynebacterium sp. ACRPY]